MTKRTILGLMAAAMLLLVTAPLALADSWNADPNHSLLTFKVRHFFSKTGGAFGEWTAVIDFDPEHPEQGSVELTILTASIDTGDEKRDGHLRSEDFFDVEKFPTISFKSTKVEADGDELMVTGDLTMHGVTKEITIPMSFNGAGPDPWGGTRAGFSGAVEINRKDFEIIWNSTMDKGGTVLGEDVTITIEIEAVKQAS